MATHKQFQEVLKIVSDNTKSKIEQADAICDMFTRIQTISTPFNTIVEQRKGYDLGKVTCTTNAQASNFSNY